MINDIKKELTDLNTTPKKLRAFGLLFGGLFAAWAGVVYWKSNMLSPWVAGTALGFFLTGLFFPKVLRQPYRQWMLLSFVIGWFMTRAMLMISYVILITPLGLFLRWSGKDLLNERIDANIQSYWNTHKTISDSSQYEKQF